MTQPLSIFQSQGIIQLNGDAVTPAMQLQTINKGAIQATWIGVSSFSGRFVVQGSLAPDDGWNDIAIDTSSCLVDIDADSQIWEITEITVPYYRLRYEANGNTTGQAHVRFYGTNS